MAKKRKAGKGKAMNKKKRDILLTLLDSIDSSIFKGAICDKVKEQMIIPEKLKQLACHLLENEQLESTGAASTLQRRCTRHIIQLASSIKRTV